MDTNKHEFGLKRRILSLSCPLSLTPRFSWVLSDYRVAANRFNGFSPRPSRGLLPLPARDERGEGRGEGLLSAFMATKRLPVFAVGAINKPNHPRASAACLFAAALLLASVCTSMAAMLYVDVNSANPTAPYSSWATAAATIQD